MPMLAVITGDTEPRKHWTFHDAYCGIGNVRAGLELAGGECTGAFDRCQRARQVYAKRFGCVAQGALETVDMDRLGAAEVLYSAPPCESKRHKLGERKGKQMWKQLELVDQFKYKICVFEVLHQFKRMEQGLVFRDFVGEMQAREYVMHSESLFTPDFGSAAARRRTVLVGMRQGVKAEVGRCTAQNRLFFFGRSGEGGFRGLGVSIVCSRRLCCWRWAHLGLCCWRWSMAAASTSNGIPGIGGYHADSVTSADSVATMARNQKP